MEKYDQIAKMVNKGIIEELDDFTDYFSIDLSPEQYYIDGKVPVNKNDSKFLINYLEKNSPEFFEKAENRIYLKLNALYSKRKADGNNNELLSVLSNFELTEKDSHDILIELDDIIHSNNFLANYLYNRNCVEEQLKDYKIALGIAANNENDSLMKDLIRSFINMYEPEENLVDYLNKMNNDEELPFYGKLVSDINFLSLIYTVVYGYSLTEEETNVLKNEVQDKNLLVGLVEATNDLSR